MNWYCNIFIHLRLHVMSSHVDETIRRNCFWSYARVTETYFLICTERCEAETLISSSALMITADIIGRPERGTDQSSSGHSISRICTAAREGGINETIPGRT